MELKHSRFAKFEDFEKLLIVPYGIETVCYISPGISVFLLIVPYGIETTFYFFFIIGSWAFNCTLWN